MALSERLSPQQRSEMLKAKIDQQKEMLAKMNEINLFPGTIDELRELTGNEYEFIKLPNEKLFLTGGLEGFEVPIDLREDGSVRIPIQKRELLNPKTLFSMRFKWTPRYQVVGYNAYRSVLADAVEIGADALVHHQIVPASFSRDFWESGMPVKRVGEQPSLPFDLPETQLTANAPEVIEISNT